MEIYQPGTLPNAVFNIIILIGCLAFLLRLPKQEKTWLLKTCIWIDLVGLVGNIYKIVELAVK